MIITLVIIIWLLIGIINYQVFVKDALIKFIEDSLQHKVSKWYIKDTIDLGIKGDKTLFVIFLLLGIIPLVYVFISYLIKLLK